MATKMTPRKKALGGTEKIGRWMPNCRPGTRSSELLLASRRGNNEDDNDDEEDDDTGDKDHATRKQRTTKESKGDEKVGEWCCVAARLFCCGRCVVGRCVVTRCVGVDVVLVWMLCCCGRCLS